VLGPQAGSAVAAVEMVWPGEEGGVEVLETGPDGAPAGADLFGEAPATTTVQPSRWAKPARSPWVCTEDSASLRMASP
jgi:hypothetical protein